MFPIKNIMERTVTTVSPETHMYVAMNLFVKEQISAMPVIDENNALVGIITERDFLELLLSGEDQHRYMVSDYMTKDVKAFDSSVSAVEVCELFMNSPIHMVPVLENGKFVGVVRRRDIIYLILHLRGKIYKKKQ